MKAGKEKMAFLHFNFTHIFFEANESLKYGARLQAALLKADIFTHSGTLSLWMKSFYLAVERWVCARVAFMCLCANKKETIWCTGPYNSEMFALRAGLCTCKCMDMFLQHIMLSGRVERIK